MKHKFLLFLLLFCIVLQGQDDTANNENKKYNYELDLGVGTYYQFTTFGTTNFNSVKIPELLPRRASEPSVRNTWGLNGDKVTDNPFFHGSYFFKLGTRFQFGESMSVTAAIIAEQRGFSDGVFSSQTRNFYPYLNVAYSKEIGKLSYLIQIGDFRNFKLYEGLTFYNLETQSWVFKFKYGKFYFKHAGIGDLLRGIGLGIDDVYDYSFGLEELTLNEENTLQLDLKSGYSNNRGFLARGFWNFSGHLDYENKYSLYSQLSVNRGNGSALLLGIAAKQQFWDKVDVKISTEYRNYEAGFNLFFNNTVYYRNPTESALFINSTNNVFIPLDYYERKFSQWAVFTEYQNIDIKGISVVADIKYNFSKKWFFDLSLDFNWLISKEETFLYPFYQIGFGVRPLKAIETSLTLTNKVMNLDKNYPTFYVSQAPYFIFKLYKPLKFIKENDEKHFAR